jgi:beta-glucanase (GH16 family)
MKFLFSLLFATTSLMSLCQWNLIWSDEFDGTELDDSKWTNDVGGWGWGNNELQYYTDGDNLLFSGSELSIEARDETFGSNSYTSAKIISKDKFEVQYGKIEARIRVPMGQGLWPAFWMLGANFYEVGWPLCGEIDIMEHVNNEMQIHGTMHWDAGGYASYGGSTGTDPSEYHVYAIEWDASEIRWYLDGAEYHVADIENGVNSTSEFHEPFYLILNLAVGGNWPGSPDGSTSFPAQLDIDYVRVYKNELQVITEVCEPASEVRMTGPWWGWNPAGGPVAADNGDGSWTFTLSPPPTENMEYLLVADGVVENLIDDMQNGGDCAPITDFSTYANRQWLTTDPLVVTNTYGQCGECNPPADLVIITEVCAPVAEVRMTGPWWGWNPSGGPVAVDNGDGTWTFTFSPAPTENMEYLLVVNGVQESLLDDVINGGDCAPVTDNATHANRLWLFAGPTTIYNIYGQCTACLCEASQCPGDLNDDGVVNTSDLLDLLSNYGGFCVE